MNTQALQRCSGFTLVELMIAMVLGLLVTGGVIGVFLSNQQVYRQNENLARLQENARYALEVMARDIREAGGIACGKNPPIANVLENADDVWWSTWGDGIVGYEGTDNTFPKAFGTAVNDRVSDTDAITILSATTNNGLYITQHNPEAASFKVNLKDKEKEEDEKHDIKPNDVLMICDDKSAAIFQVTNTNGKQNIVHNPGTGSIGNCTKSLRCAVDIGACGASMDETCIRAGYNGCFFNCSKDKNEVEGPGFSDGGFVSKLSSHAWYIGRNALGGNSLYRIDQNTTEEIVDGVRDLQIQYLAGLVSGVTQYVDATSITDWGNVTAVRLVFTFETLENVSVEANSTIQRDWVTVVSIRNRLP